MTLRLVYKDVYLSSLWASGKPVQPVPGFSSPEVGRNHSRYGGRNGLAEIGGAVSRTSSIAPRDRTGDNLEFLR